MSGFRESFEKEIWKPHGSPTIYKLLEHLQNQDFKKYYYFIDDQNLSKKKVNFQNINLNADIISSKTFFFKKMSFYLNTLTHFLYISIKIFFHKPDIIYVDRGNVVLAALFCRILKRKVVLRVLGIPTPLQNLKEDKGIYSMVLRWAYKSKFAWVLFTEEGSNPKNWANKNLSKNIKKSFWINGVDGPININVKKKKRIDILFISRLTSDKGCFNLLKSMKKLSKTKLKKNWVLHIIGNGDKSEEMKNYVCDNMLENKVIFYGSIEHNKIHKFYNFGDIYISLNNQGNISNSNLEALNYNLKCIFLGKTSKNIDKLTEILFPEVNFIDRDNIVKNLTLMLQKIINGNSFKLNSNVKLTSWNDRISKEIDKLRSLFDE